MSIALDSYRQERDSDASLRAIVINLAVSDIIANTHAVDLDVITRKLRGLAFNTHSGTTIADTIIANRWRLANNQPDMIKPIEEFIVGTLTGTDGAIISLDVLSPTTCLTKTASWIDGHESYLNSGILRCGDVATTTRPVVQIQLRPHIASLFQTVAAEQYARRIAHSIITRFDL